MKIKRQQTEKTLFTSHLKYVFEIQESDHVWKEPFGNIFFLGIILNIISIMKHQI